MLSTKYLPGKFTLLPLLKSIIFRRKLNHLYSSFLLCILKLYIFVVNLDFFRNGFVLHMSNSYDS